MRRGVPAAKEYVKRSGLHSVAERDGTFACRLCRQGLNETDANCWRCGSKDIEDKRPKPAEDVLVLDVEDILRSWADSGQFAATT